MKEHKDIWQWEQDTSDPCSFPHLIWLDCISCFHFCEDFQGRVQLPALHKALDEGTVAPHIQGHT